MKKIVDSAYELIGETPILNAKKFALKNDVKDVELLVKLEYLNPAGSVKDRIAYAMILDAEKSGKLKSGGTIIEPTSGNTGIGIASIATQRGYKAILTMPETMSVERRNMLKAYGASIELTSGSDGMKGAIKKAKELNEQISNSVILGQFDNHANVKIHYETTGPEIWEQTEGKIDIFVAGIGTGGTITGVGQFLKSKNPNIKIVPSILDTKVYDEIITIENEDAFDEGRKFASAEGILVGISSGAALKAGVMLAKQNENRNKKIVVLLPDSGDRYLSTQLFNTEV